MASSALRSYDEEQLFQFAIEGRVRKIQKLLEKNTGIPVDITNNKGQTLLYISCIYRRVKTASCLLQYGADPNRRSDDGSTPTHAAAYSCSVELLKCLVEEHGGDMRLHDKLSRTPKDWAMRAGKKISKKVIHLITAWQKNVDSTLLLWENSGNIKKWSADLSTGNECYDLLKNDMKIDFHGYGDYLCRTRPKHGCPFIGLPAVLPLASSYHFTSPNGHTLVFRSPPVFLMEEALWCSHSVMIKRARGKDKTAPTFEEDCLLSEAKACRSLRHPNLLLLMAICLTSSKNSYTNAPSHLLVYEPMCLGSLHHVLHKLEIAVSLHDVAKHMIQIASALSYVHDRGFVHSAVSSHAVYLTDTNTAKLGDLMYITVCGDKVMSHHPFPPCLNRWAAPEIILDLPVSRATDVYSFCIVISEAVSGTLPWKGCDNDSVKTHILSRRNYSMLPDYMPAELKSVLQKGLKYSNKSRRLQIESLSSCLKNLITSDKLKLAETNKKTSVCHMTERVEKQLQAGDLLSKEWDGDNYSKDDCPNGNAVGIDVPDARPIHDGPQYKVCKTEHVFGKNSNDTSHFLQQSLLPAFQNYTNILKNHDGTDCCPSYNEVAANAGGSHDCSNTLSSNAINDCQLTVKGTRNQHYRIGALKLQEHHFGKPGFAKRPHSCGILGKNEESVDNSLAFLPVSCPDITRFYMTSVKIPDDKSSNGKMENLNIERHSPRQMEDATTLTPKKHDLPFVPTMCPGNKVSVGTNTEFITTQIPNFQEKALGPPSLSYALLDSQHARFSKLSTTMNVKNQSDMLGFSIPSLNLASCDEFLSDDDIPDGVHDLQELTYESCLQDEQPDAKAKFSDYLRDRKCFGIPRVRRLSLPVISKQYVQQCVSRKSLSHLDTTSEIDKMFNIESQDLEEIFRGFARRGMDDNVKFPKHETADKLVGSDEILENNIQDEVKHSMSSLTAHDPKESDQQLVVRRSPYPCNDANGNKGNGESQVEDSPSCTFMTCVDDASTVDEKLEVIQNQPASVFATEMVIAASLTNDNIEVDTFDFNEKKSLSERPIKREKADECLLSSKQNFIIECNHSPKCETATKFDNQTDGMKTPSKWSFDKKLSLFKVRAEVDEKFQRGISVACRAMFEGDNTITSKPIVDQNSKSDEAKDTDKVTTQSDIVNSNLEQKSSNCFENLVRDENEFKTSTPVSQTNTSSRSKPVEYKEPLTPRSFADVRADIEAASSPIKSKPRLAETSPLIKVSKTPILLTANKTALRKRLTPMDVVVHQNENALSSVSTNNIYNTIQTNDDNSETTALETSEEHVEGEVSQLLHEMLFLTSTDKCSEVDPTIKNVSTVENNNMHFIKTSMSDFDESSGNLNDTTGASFIKDPRIFATGPIKSAFKTLSRSVPSNLDGSKIETKFAKDDFSFILKGAMVAPETDSVLTEGNGQECSSLLMKSTDSHERPCQHSVDTSVWSV